jgi:formylglycine-generating enzyme required for sulfatase activity
MGRSLDGSDAFDCQQPSELPEHDAYVATFTIDVYEVTVGRFRKFVEGYGGPPDAGAGANPNIPGSGWEPTLDSGLVPAPFDSAALSCSAYATWTAAPSNAEDKPITCVNWYEAYAFCIWDGARLPVEVEWEFAAAAGKANRLYPWGADVPDGAYANFGCSINAPCTDRVGVRTAGQGLHGEMDLAGNAWEWMRDYYNPAFYGDASAPCASAECANLTMPQNAIGPRTVRGGASTSSAVDLRAARRLGVPSDYRAADVSFRCVR